MVNVQTCGAIGDGKHDDFSAVMAALQSDEREIFFPKGVYTVSDTVKIPAHKVVRFEEGAVLKLHAKTPRKRGDFLLTNSGHEDIAVIGGTLDGNNRSPFHKRPKNIFQKDGYSGILLNFCDVKNLTLKDIHLTNPVAYYTRFCKIENFLLENITLSSDKLCPNQDGIHFAGLCKHGVVKNIRAVTYGETNDDFLALNADDSTERIEEFDTECGIIEDIVFEDIFAGSCHSAVRLLSFRSAIQNITFRNMNIGFRHYAVNAGAARDCRAPLFEEKDYPNGVGAINNILFENCIFRLTTDYPVFWKGSSKKDSHPFLWFATLSDHIIFRNCRFVKDSLQANNFIRKIRRNRLLQHSFPVFKMELTPNQRACFDGKEEVLTEKQDILTVDTLSFLSIEKI